eukprot:TRINITY_DN3972_c1_g1_i1.p1 TRINITY_DN3972_c1_g1~~TRINITY_DN3972_c1_g1_i1.p1  ORF type:complete len:58 (-),score=8.57 TRINITY_DN3972_c1_g1_i1:21-194(-)
MFFTVGDTLTVSKSVLFILKLRAPPIMTEITPKVYGVIYDHQRIHYKFRKCLAPCRS